MDFFKKATANLGSGAESDLMKQAEGFMGNQGSAPATNTGSAPAGNPSSGAPLNAPPASDIANSQGGENYTQLYGNAQTLYQGLQDKFSGRQTNVDDQQLAGAAANVLKAAEDSGYVKDSQYADYFNKAEGYLQNYGGGKQGTGPSAPISQAPTQAPTHAPTHAPTSAPATAPNAGAGAGAPMDSGAYGATGGDSGGYGATGGDTGGYGATGARTGAGPPMDSGAATDAGAYSATGGQSADGAPTSDY